MGAKTKMKALLLEEYGGPEQLRMKEVSQPEPGDDEVLVENYSTSVNPVDWKVRAGVFKDVLPFSLPLIIGHDVAGVICDVGHKVTAWKKGDRILAKNQGLNAFAEFVTVKQDLLARVPDAVTFHEAACMGTAGVAAYKSLFHFGHLQKDQKVLVHGGAGGVGSLVVQLAKIHGAWVASTASTGNISLLMDLGVDVAIDYLNHDFAKDSEGYDLVIDLVGGDVQTRSLNVLKPGGTLVSVHPFSEKGIQRNVRLEVLKAVPDPHVLQKLMEHIVNGELKAVISQVLPFEEKALQQANEKIETGHGRGKMVVEIKKEVETLTS